MGTVYLLRASLRLAPDYCDFLPNTQEEAMWLAQHKGGIARLIGALSLLFRVIVKRQKVHSKRITAQLKR